MDTYLVGSGHFAIGFILGFIWMLYLFRRFPEKLNVQLYAPFLPMIIGVFAVLPYPFYIGQNDLPLWLHLFVLFPFFHTDQLFIILLGRPAFVAILCGALYLFIVWRYIKLAKYSRKNGWNEKYELPESERSRYNDAR